MRTGTAFLLSLFLSACASTAQLPSRAAFSEQVLSPLAKQRSVELVQESKERFRSAYLEIRARDQSFPLDKIIFSALGHSYPVIGVVLESLVSTKRSPETEIELGLAWLDTRRALAERAILAHYESDLKEADDYFEVCTQNKERRYDRSIFRRLDDGPACQSWKIDLLNLK